MIPAPPSADEAARLRVLAELNLLDTPADPVLDGLARSAASGTASPIALIGLVDHDRQWFKARAGVVSTQTPRESAFCAYTILGDDLFEVPDATRDPRFADKPFVTGEPHVRFYAGVPLVVDGQRIGTLCVIDYAPRRLDAAQRALLVDLARSVEHWIVSGRKFEQAHREKVASQRACRAKSELLSRVSHELRTPLNAVLGFTHLMQADAQLPAHAQGQLRHIRRAGQHLLEMVDDILDMTGIQQGLRTLQTGPVEVTDLLAASLALIEPLANERAIRIMPTRGDDSVVAHADARALEQVLLNLLSNAVKYNREHGLIWVDVRNAGPEVVIGVGDEGQGLSEVQRRGLFQPYDRLGAQDSQVQGVGLGLVISKQLVEAMQGRLVVHARPEGGCRFEIRLPASPLSHATRPVALEGGAEDRTTAGAGTDAQAPLLLCVDDDPVSALLLREAIEPLGRCRLLFAQDGEEALRMAKTHRPDLMVSDVNLPRMDGVALVKAIRADPVLRSMRCIALSGDALSEAIDRALKAGFDVYWTKPLDLAVLFREIGSLEPR